MSRVQSLDESATNPCEPMCTTSRSESETRIDRAHVRAFVFLSLVYFVAVFTLSSVKLLWLDELITLHIARYGGPAAIWQALARGADPNPPITHILVHYTRALFGEHEWALRLPAMIGYWVGLLSLFLYLRGRVTGTWAIGGSLLSMCMGAFEYSYESRSYGIFYGLAMLAFFCWTRLADPSRTRRAQWLALAGMTFALATGISTNYFAVLAFLPITAGEIARTLMRRRSLDPSSRSSFAAAIDWWVWIGMAVAASPLLVYHPLIQHAIAQFSPYAWNKVSLDQVSDSYTDMVEVVLYPILGLFIFAAIAWFSSRAASSLCDNCRLRAVRGWRSVLLGQDQWRWGIPLHEALAVFFFMLYPILGYIIASIRGGMLSPRFVIPVCFGFAIAGTLVAAQLFGKMRRGGLVFVCFLAAWFLCRESVIGYWYEEQKQCFYKVVDRLPEALAKVPANAPIAIPDPLLALTFQHYAPPSLAAREVFPVDFPAIRHYRHDDSPEENLWAGRSFLYSLPIETMAKFARNTHQYVIVTADWNWMLDDLSDHHYLVVRLPINTRAGAMGGFTPLARGTPAFWIASWDHPLQSVWSPFDVPIPFKANDEVPQAKGEYPQ